MRAISLTMFAAGLAAQLSGAAIQFEVSNLGGGTFQYTYSVTSFLPCTPSCAGDTLDLSFDGSVYNLLSNPVAQPSSDWSTTLFQPNTLPGLAGDFLVTALVDHPSLAGPLSVDFTLQQGGSPGSQPFTIFDANFNAVGSGETTSGVTTSPEPANLLLVAGALIGICLTALVKRRRECCRL